MRQFLETSVRLAASCQVLFDFHADPHNLEKVSPPWLKLISVEGGMPPEEGMTFTVRVRQAGWPGRWMGRWDRVECPHLLVDAGLQSPFGYWLHEHRFTPCPGGSLLTDRVEFELKKPLCWLPPARWVAMQVMRAMFRYRHRRSREIFGDPVSGE